MSRTVTHRSLTDRAVRSGRVPSRTPQGRLLDGATGQGPTSVGTAWRRTTRPVGCAPGGAPQAAGDAAADEPWAAEDAAAVPPTAAGDSVLGPEDAHGPVPDPEAGMATAEYAIATVAAAGFAGLLVVILRSAEVRELLLGIVRSALSV